MSHMKDFLADTEEVFLDQVAGEIGSNDMDYAYDAARRWFYANLPTIDLAAWDSTPHELPLHLARIYTNEYL